MEEGEKGMIDLSICPDTEKESRGCVLFLAKENGMGDTPEVSRTRMRKHKFWFKCERMSLGYFCRPRTAGGR